MDRVDSYVKGSGASTMYRVPKSDVFVSRSRIKRILNSMNMTEEEYCWKYLMNLTDPPVCKLCGQFVKYKGKLSWGFDQFCCRSHHMIYEQNYKENSSYKSEDHYIRKCESQKRDWLDGKYNFSRSGITPYSKMSFKLFSLVEYSLRKIDKTIGDILYGPNEHRVYDLPKCIDSCKFRSLDFYVPKYNKVIEFDGTYYHGGKSNMSQQVDHFLNDTRRDSSLKSLGYDILHVTEEEFRKMYQN